MTFADIIKFVETKAAGKSSIIEGKEVILVSPDNWVEISTLTDMTYTNALCQLKCE